MLENFKTFFLTAIPSSPAFFFAVESPSKASVIVTIILPILFFAVGKTVDVYLQIHFRRQEAKRQIRNQAVASFQKSERQQLFASNSNSERKNTNNEKI